MYGDYSVSTDGFIHIKKTCSSFWNCNYFPSVTVRPQRGADCWDRPPCWRGSSALTLCYARSWPMIHVREKSYPEDLSGTSLPKLCWFILHEKCGRWEEFFGPSSSLPAETKSCYASILITAFALQWFAFPKLSSYDKGDNLHYFLLIKSQVTPLQTP